MGGRRRMLSLLQVTREDVVSAVVVIVTRLDLIDPGKYLNPEEAKSPAIVKMA